MKIEPFERYAEKYEEWFENNVFVYESELQAVRVLLPKKGIGMEIGIGTGRFAAPLGIKIGVEPANAMRTAAQERKLEVIDGVAEALPFPDEHFDFALMVTTLCFVDDVEHAFQEAYRVIKPGGYFLNGFVDRDSFLGKIYEQHKKENVFYKSAQFYSVAEVIVYLEKTGFHDLKFTQTVFHRLEQMTEVEPVQEGYGKGAFIVVRARKM
ncbi:MAG: class I SAM-dependent methyltransferase [Candidatus Vecturithrix sp.]|jgi:ubiquinone/menaquinone biosynthesis C-methylase UbiE|nr:class I SAM-dependent methyltransferase [Candidatus Vecturithrix sp.]